jgi:hypothetical protein
VVVITVLVKIALAYRMETRSEIAVEYVMGTIRVAEFVKRRKKLPHSLMSVAFAAETDPVVVIAMEYPMVGPKPIFAASVAVITAAASIAQALPTGLPR